VDFHRAVQYIRHAFSAEIIGMKITFDAAFDVFHAVTGQYTPFYLYKPWTRLFVPRRPVRRSWFSTTATLAFPAMFPTGAHGRNANGPYECSRRLMFGWALSARFTKFTEMKRGMLNSFWNQ
jgi:hypothetical protein